MNDRRVAILYVIIFATHPQSFLNSKCTNDINNQSPIHDDLHFFDSSVTLREELIQSKAELAIIPIRTLGLTRISNRMPLRRT